MTLAKKIAAIQPDSEEDLEATALRLEALCTEAATFLDTLPMPRQRKSAPDDTVSLAKRALERQRDCERAMLMAFLGVTRPVPLLPLRRTQRFCDGSARKLD